MLKSLKPVHFLSRYVRQILANSCYLKQLFQQLLWLYGSTVLPSNANSSEGGIRGTTDEGEVEYENLFKENTTCNSFYPDLAELMM